MVRADKGGPGRVSLLLTEDSVVEEASPGFSKTEWSVGVNDGWMPLTQLVRRRGIGEITVEVEDEYDPNEAASGSHWADRPPQVWYRRRTYVVAPVRTRFRSSVWRPVRDRYGVRFPRKDDEFVLCRDGRLARPEHLAERAAQKARRAAQPPMSTEETCDQARAVLAKLGEPLAVRGRRRP